MHRASTLGQENVMPHQVNFRMSNDATKKPYRPENVTSGLRGPCSAEHAQVRLWLRVECQIHGRDASVGRSGLITWLRYMAGCDRQSRIQQ